MVQANGGDTRYHQLWGLYDICSIQRTSKPALEHHIVALGPLKFQEADHGHDFKKSNIKIELFDSFENALTRFNDVLHGAQLAVNCDPLPKGGDMRGNEHANPESHLLECAGHLDGDTPLSVGASHMHKLKVALVRVAKMGCQLLHLLQAELLSVSRLLVAEHSPGENFV
jgi:hypothetical protein